MQPTVGRLALAIGLGAAGAFSGASARGNQEQPPVPIVAEWPFALERKVHAIEGNLRFTLRVERGVVVGVGVTDDASPELAQAGLQAVSTWRFPPMLSTTLATTVSHRLDGVIDCDGDANQTIRAQLPAFVEVVSRKYVRFCGPGFTVKWQPPVSRLSGRVTCACASKEPIAGARLSVFVEGPAQTSAPPRAIRHVLTDSDGRFRILGLSPGPYRLEIEKEDFRRMLYGFAIDPSSNSDPAEISLERTEQLPPTQVIGGSIPTYPVSARTSGVQGEVDLRVSMEGDEVLDIDADSQSDVLAKAAAANVRTWKFRSTTVPVLSIRFVYAIDPGDCHAAANPMVTMRLPDSVTVRAIGIPCAPMQRRVQEPLLLRPGGTAGGGTREEPTR